MDNNLQFNNQNQDLGNSGNNMNKQNMIKYGVVGVVAVVAVILIVVLFSSLFGSSYKDPLKGAVKAFNKHNEDSYSYKENNTLKEYAAYNKLWAEITEEGEDTYEDAVEALKEEFGDNYKISYKITDKEKLDKDDLEDLQDYFEDAYEDVEDGEDDKIDSIEAYCEEEDISSKDEKKLTEAWEKYVKSIGKVKVSKAYEVDIEFTIKGKEDDDDFKAKNVIVAKINGDWMMFSEIKFGDEKYYSSLDITPSAVCSELEIEIDAE